MIAGQPTTLTFSLVAPSGVTYQSPVVTVESNPWSTSSALTDNGDGTYSITITPDRETKTYIKLKVVDAGKTYYHTLETLSEKDSDVVLSMGNVTGPTNNIVYMYFTFKDAQGRVKLWDLRPSGKVLDDASIQVTSSKAGVTFSAITNGIDSGSLPNGYIGATINWGTEDQTQGIFSFDIIHPVSKRRRHFSQAVDLYRAITPAWITTAQQYIGIETTLQFSLKYASGKPVVGAVLAPTTAVGATVNPNIVVVDAANGVYGVKVTPTAANFSINPQVRVGNNPVVVSVGNRAFTAINMATPTLPAVYGSSRTIGILLRDNAGVISDATITGISAGSYIDAATGPWTVYNASTGLYKVAVSNSKQGVPANTNTTPKSTDTVQVTFTRGGQTYTVPMTIDIYWRVTKLNVDAMQSSGGATQLTPAGSPAPWGTPDSTWTFSAPTVYGLDGGAKGSGGTMTNSIATTGKVVWNAPIISSGSDLGLWGTATSGSTTYYYWSEPFSIVRQGYMVITPLKTTQYVDTGPYTRIPPFQFTQIAVTITDDLGNPITDASISDTTLPVQNWRNNIQAIGGWAGVTKWSQTIVPQTNGMDGKYYLRWANTAIIPDVVLTTGSLAPTFTSAQVPNKQFVFSIGINTAPL